MAYRYRNAHLSNIVIDGVDCTQYFTFPFTVQETLDESLDSAMITLVGMKRKEPFRAFCDAELGTDKDGRIDMLVANDDVKEIYGRGVYTHEITLIEPTKLLERYIMGAKAFTNHRERKYVITVDGGGEAPVYIYKNQVNGNGGSTVTEDKSWTNLYLKRQAAGDKFVVPGLDSVYYIDCEPRYMQYIRLFFSENNVENDTWNMTEIYSFDFSGKGIEDQFNYSITIDLAQCGYAYRSGYFVIEYEAKTIPVSSYLDTYYINVGIEVESVDSINVGTIAPYSILDVLKILRDQAEPICKGERARFSLEPYEAQKQKMENTVAPEFKFPDGRSLWENLREVCGFMHYMPRLVRSRIPNRLTKYAIRFDFLGSTEYADMSRATRFSGNMGMSASDYALALESRTENLTNGDDEAEGSITTPSRSTFISLRSDNARIKQEDSYIPTPFPIEKLIKLELFATVDGTNRLFDITPYVFEKNEYELLSSNNVEYPYSKTYALYYTQGKRNIEGLWYRAQDGLTDLQNAFKRYSITNIYNVVAGKNDWHLGYFSIVFRITYIPSVSARVRQYKTDVRDIGDNGALTISYNQSVNKINARSFGENIRGKMAMLGNRTEKAMYLFPCYHDIPKPGLLLDKENYISTVTTQIYPDFCVSEIAAAKGYNELGSYVGLNNAYRQFEIPSENERHFHVDELCLISDHTVANRAGRITTDSGMQFILRTIAGVNGAYTHETDISVARVYTKNENTTTIAESILPVVSTAIGNSMLFAFRFEDNFSAGSSANGTGTENVTSGNESQSREFRYTRYEPYGDAFARVKYMTFELFYKINETDKWLDQAHAYPKREEEVQIGGDIAFGSQRKLWVYDKDAADGGDISFQLHFVSDSGFIIGSALARQCPLVRTNASLGPATIVYYKNRINELTGDNIDQSNDVVGTSDLSIDFENWSVNVNNPPPSAPFSSWRIERDGECLIGCNSNTAPKYIYFRIQKP